MKKDYYKNIKFELNTVSYEFSKFDKNKKTIDVSINDKVIINKIFEDSISVEVVREIEFNKTQIIKVSYNCEILTTKEISKEIFINDIKSGLIIFTDVYANISLIIANITAQSPFEVFITPPLYDKKSIIIE